MPKASNYDSEVQMFVQRPREIDPAHLRFLRWLAVRGSLEHEPLSRSYGVYAVNETNAAHTESSRPDRASAHSEWSE
jgi:hypothetical protein